MMESIPSVSKSLEFSRQVVQAGRPVMVIFFASWCEDSRQLASVADALTDAYRDKLKFMKIDIDMSPNLTDYYDVEVTPTVILFDRAEVVARWENDADPESYHQVLNSVLVQHGQA